VSVLQRQELEGSPLADLHAIASELGVEGYRGLRKAELIEAIVNAQGGGDAPTEGPGDDDPVSTEAEPETADEPGEDDEPEAKPRRSRRSRRERSEPESGSESESGPKAEPEPERTEEQRSGVLDILGNGSGFVRADVSRHSPEDVYVSPAQIRRCELRAGDEVSGPARPPRRSERHPSLVRIEQVNGQPAEPPQERPNFQDLTAVFPTERLTTPAGLDAVPFGKGSRVAISDAPDGPPAGGAGALLRAIAVTLADSHSDLDVAVVLAGIRPEEVTDWRGDERLTVIGDGSDRSPEAVGQVAEFAVERAKRVVERGGDAVLLIDSLGVLGSGTQRRLFGAARKLEQGGSLTVVAATGQGTDVDRLVTTRIALAPSSGADPEVDQARSGTLRADLLG